MHELSVAISILEIAEKECERRGGTRVVAVHLKLGPLSGVVKEALVSAYEIALEGSSLARSQLIVEEVPVVVACPVCQRKTVIASIQQLCCANCGTPTADIISGNELEVAALEIERDLSDTTR